MEVEKKQKKSLSPWKKSVIAGSISGMASVLVCHPFDTIRTRLQISPTRFSNSFFVCVEKTITQEGIFGLYKGFLPPFFSQAIYKSVIFTTSNKFRNDILHSNSLTPNMISFISGAFAGGLNAFLVAPIELIRNRLQIQYHNNSPKSYHGTWHCFSSVLKREGFFALWKGLGSTILRDSFGVAFYFLTFDFAKQKITEKAPKNPDFVRLSAGALSGIAFWTIALPFDTVKSLIQVDVDGKYCNLSAATRVLLKENGIGGLFRGWQAAFSRGIPGAAVTFWAFENSTKYLEQLED
jgi:solute carrier family 25 carnitine/acylcarnitine transporter 20/29